MQPLATAQCCNHLRWLVTRAIILAIGPGDHMQRITTSAVIGLLFAASASAQTPDPSAAYSTEQIQQGLVDMINDGQPRPPKEAGLSFIVYRNGKVPEPVEGYRLAGAENAGKCTIRLKFSSSWNGGIRTEMLMNFTAFSGFDPYFKQVSYTNKGDKKFVYGLSSEGALRLGAPLMTFSRILEQRCHRSG